MLDFQVRLLTAWLTAGEQLASRFTAAQTDKDRGEVTAQTAMIVLLVVAAIAAGIVIAAKINSNANNIPDP